MADAQAAVEARDFSRANEECDLILKGGVTSGVVYPEAILELATRYRFRSIGGASVGAIAAGFAAAAEYARQRGDPDGYLRLEEACKNLQCKLKGLFQPTKSLRPVFDAFLAIMKPRTPSVAGDPDSPLTPWACAKLVAVLWALRLWLGIGAVPGVLLGLTLWFLRAPCWPSVAWVLVVGVTGAVGYTVWRLWNLAKRFHEHNFGLCSGHGADTPALTDWVHESIQTIAFGDANREPPLTFGDLAKAKAGAGIDLRLTTTNLSLQRPEVIPRIALNLLYDPKAWEALFPPAVMRYLARRPSREVALEDKLLRPLPKGDQLPVVVGIRMSLCYPVLFQAVPMFMKDRARHAKGEAGGTPAPILPVWFTDGGITSNFPIHFFDALLPQRPTIAISLDSRRDLKSDAVSMPQRPADAALRPVEKVSGLAGFAMGLFGTARSWQDEMQSVLPAQRQRIVRVFLDQHEGGLNLDMPPATIEALIQRGRDAGRLARTEFDFEEHRWRRAVVAYEQLETLSRAVRKVWPSYAGWFVRYAPDSYKNLCEHRPEIRRRITVFSKGAAAMRPPLEAAFPKPKARLVSRPDV